MDNFNRESLGIDINSGRKDILDLYLFNTLDEVRQMTEQWIELYNRERPHDGLNDMTPIEYLNAA